METILPLVAVIGFAIQQFLQILVDPLASLYITRLRNRQPPGPDGTRVLPGGVSEMDLKRTIMGAVAFALGLVVVLAADDKLLILTELNESFNNSLLDVLVSALVVGAGTEGANSVLKALQYGKDALKARAPLRNALNSPVPQEPAGLLGAGGIHESTPNLEDDREAALEQPAEPPRGEGGEGAERTLVLAEAAAAPRPWRVAGCLLKLRSQIDANAPHRNRVSDGTIGDEAHQTRDSDHNAWVTDGGMGVVTALDVTHDPAGGCNADTLAEALRASQDHRIKYIIRNRKIASSYAHGGTPPWRWRPYNGENPHRTHVHISVKSEKDDYDDTASWTIAL